MKFFGSKSLYFLILVNVLFGAVLLRTVHQYNDFVRSSEEKEKENVIALTKKAAQELGAIAAHVEERTKKLAAAFSKQPILPIADIEKQLAAELNSNEDLLGCGIFYSSYAYSKEKYLFGPYLHRTSEGYKFTDTGVMYDYTADAEKSQFFHRPFKKNKAMWSEPFWGEASEKLLITYSFPFYSGNNPDNPVGIITQSLSLDKIHAILSSLDVGPDGFPALTTQAGNYLYHPTIEFVTGKRNLLDVAKETDDKDRMFIAQAAQGLKGGFIDHLSVSTQKNAWLVWEPVPSSGWSLQVTFLKEDMFIDKNAVKQKKIHILVSSIIFLVALCALILQAVPINEHKKRWIFSISSSFFMLFGVGLIWNIYLFHYQSIHKDAKEIDSYGEREKIKREYYYLCRVNNLELPVYLPTGIYIDTIKFANPNEIELTGYVWQKYTIGDKNHDSLSRGIAFVGATESKITEVLKQKVLKQKQGNQYEEVIRWSFMASVREDVDYSKYPIDHASFILKIVHKDLNHNVVLIPDFESYTRIVPTLKPGLDSKIFLPGWVITSSRFMLERKVKNTNFGVEETISKQNFPFLAFSVSAKRTFINAFISSLTPLIVVYVMLFAFIFIKSDQKSILSMCSGMFFAIVVAHVNARKDISAYEIFYLEYFYIITYIVLMSLVVSSMLLHKNNDIYENKLLDTGRLLYWPVVSSSFFVITAIIFYR